MNNLDERVAATEVRAKRRKTNRAIAVTGRGRSKRRSSGVILHAQRNSRTACSAVATIEKAELLWRATVSPIAPAVAEMREIRTREIAREQTRRRARHVWRRRARARGAIMRINMAWRKRGRKEERGNDEGNMRGEMNERQTRG